MSYILEALRKVEQQREHLPSHGLSSKRRYYSSIDSRAGPYLWLIIGAVVVGALMAGVVVYFIAATQQTASAQTFPSAPAHQHPVSAHAPVASTHLAPTIAAERSSVVAQVQQQSPLVKPVSVTPPRMPGPRYQPPRKSAAPPQQHSASPPKRVVTQEPKPTIAQNKSEQEETPVEKPTAPPKQETSPDTRQPAVPPESQETDVASAHAPSTGLNGVRPPPAVNAGKSPVAAAANIADALEKIPPPKAVEVQPFRPNDVIRPPAARKSTPSSAEPPLLTTLSSQFQSMVPKMAINAQVYSAQPQRRFVIINMKRYNEGQNTAEGVNVVSIRQDDIIFAYQGQRFRIGR